MLLQFWIYQANAQHCGASVNKLLCGRSWCTFVCKWHNSKRAVLRRLRSNRQPLVDPESSQSAPAVLSILRSSPSSLAQPKSSQPASALGLCLRPTQQALTHSLVRQSATPPGEDSLAVFACCCARQRSLQSAIVSLATGWVARTEIRKPTEVCGGFKHIQCKLHYTPLI